MPDIGSLMWPDALDSIDADIEQDIAADRACAYVRSALYLLNMAYARLYSAAHNPSRALAMQDVCDASDHLHGAGRLLPPPQGDAITDMAERLDADLRECWGIPYATVDELQTEVARMIDEVKGEKS